MTTDPLSPLAEAIAPAREMARLLNDNGALAAYDSVLHVAPRYDARIRELEELAEKRREEARAWMKVANERGAELAAFRELAREADAALASKDLARKSLYVTHSLAARHKEE